MKSIKKYKEVFILGIGGSGMSSIAKYLNQRGAIVKGYDQRSSYVTNLLENDGLIVRKRGKGTLVKSSFNENDGCFESLTEKIIANGDSPSSSILEFKKIINKKK